ncbi:hypothetical protein KIW84_062757 [Lathyrus oleraceus]|uniref:Uncharacterized protein n=1 Tax=Pisum sativum TaxID=3888 RepID=A0A9D4W833_PEA|nr:hypothetical protein KIW84_062757 [Pisum sativum]
MSSLKDAQKTIQTGGIDKSGRIVEDVENKNRAGLGFQQGPFNSNVKVMQPIFYSGVFIHQDDQHSAAIIEDSDEDEACANIVTHSQTSGEENDDEEVSNELSCFLEHEEKAIQPFEKRIELVNLGFDDDMKEVNIGSKLGPEAKKGLIDLLREYSDVFSWSYQNMSGLDSKIVEHRFSLKPECPPVKQKLRRTHPDMAVKIKEEVQKQIDV